MVTISKIKYPTGDTTYKHKMETNTANINYDKKIYQFPNY